jgi:hypothetical protein
MLRHLTVFLGALACAAVLAGTAVSGAEQIHISINDSEVNDFWTDQCGTEVTISQVGDLHVTLVRNKAGLIVRETDKIGGSKIVFSSAFGSFEFPAVASQWDYGDGATLGSPVVISFTGLQGHVAGGVASDAGILRLAGVVEGFDEFGIPEVEFGDVLKDVGHRESFEAVRAAICGAVGP